MIWLAEVRRVFQIDEIPFTRPFNLTLSRPEFDPAVSVQRSNFGSGIELFDKRLTDGPERFHLAPADTDGTGSRNSVTLAHQIHAGTNHL